LKIDAFAVINRHLHKIWDTLERGSSNTVPVQKKVFNLLEQDELTRLRKEVAQLRMEREILKKAAVFFAKELQ